MCVKKENIRLDARIVSVIHDATFVAVLENGHELVAYTKDASLEGLDRVRPGSRVRLDLSPYNMGQGRIVGVLEERDDES